MFWRFVLITVLTVAWAAPGRAASPLSETDRAHYEAAYHAAANGRWQSVWRHADRAKDQFARKGLDWLYMQDRRNSRSFQEIAAFIIQNPEWPRLATLAFRAEEKIDADTPGNAILSWYEDRAPTTLNGVQHLARALTNAGRIADVPAMAQRAWIDLDLPGRAEHTFRQDFRQYITADANRARMERLLWEGKTGLAARQARRMPQAERHLAEARIALRTFAGGVDRAIARVPDRLKNDPGLIYERVRWRRRKGRNAEAADLLLNAPVDPGRWTSQWWRERGILARRALRDGKISQAYRLASDHGAEEGFPFADAEWLAGWIALRFLDDPLLAFPHFQRMYGNVSFPVSLSRAAYWAGRAAQAAGKPAIAAQWYATAARHGTSFYGQMAAAHLQPEYRPPLPREPQPIKPERAAFESRELVRLARILSVAQADRTLRRILRHLADTADRKLDYVLLSELAEDLGRPHDAVYAARQAIKKQIMLSRSGYPVVPLDRGIGLGPDVVFGVIRQESGFERAAQSSAGARGLMQLMPATAKAVAKQQQLPYRKDSLTANHHYNIALGSAYLKNLIERFDGSMILALAGYNAGPHRARRWLRDFGDPRTGVHEALDWMEMIPFEETRNYVQRVLENITVYRQRLTGDVALVSFNSATKPIDADAIWSPPPRAPRRAVPEG